MNENAEDLRLRNRKIEAYHYEDLDESSIFNKSVKTRRSPSKEWKRASDQIKTNTSKYEIEIVILIWDSIATTSAIKRSESELILFDERHSNSEVFEYTTEQDAEDDHLTMQSGNNLGQPEEESRSGQLRSGNKFQQMSQPGSSQQGKSGSGQPGGNGNAGSGGMYQSQFNNLFDFGNQVPRLSLNIILKIIPEFDGNSD